MKKHQILDAFWLKIIAMVTMTIDHCGAYFFDYSSPTYYILRIIGRISFPIFAFLITEGVHYSKKPFLYFLRLFILDIIINLGEFIFLHQYEGSVLLTFVLGGLSIYLLDSKKIYQKFFSIIPITIGILTGFSFFPIRMQYGPYGLFIILLFYFSKKLIIFINNKFSLFSNDDFYNSSYYRTLYLLVFSSIFIVLNIISVYYSYQINNFFTAENINYTIQSYACLALPILFLYNGKRGYNKKWFKYGCYLFFQLHFILLYLIKIIFLI